MADNLTADACRVQTNRVLCFHLASDWQCLHYAPSPGVQAGSAEAAALQALCILADQARRGWAPASLLGSAGAPMPVQVTIDLLNPTELVVCGNGLAKRRRRGMPLVGEKLQACACLPAPSPRKTHKCCSRQVVAVHDGVGSLPQQHRGIQVT